MSFTYCDYNVFPTDKVKSSLLLLRWLVTLFNFLQFFLLRSHSQRFTSLFLLFLNLIGFGLFFFFALEYLTNYFTVFEDGLFGSILVNQDAFPFRLQIFYSPLIQVSSFKSDGILLLLIDTSVFESPHKLFLTYLHDSISIGFVIKPLSVIF